MKTNKGGFTLVEMMIALTISIVVLGATITMLIHVLWVWRDGTSHMYLTEQTRLVREKVLRGLDGRYGLRQASAANITILPAAGNGQDTLTFNIETNQWPTTTSDDDRQYTVQVDSDEELWAVGSDSPTRLIRPDIKTKLLDFTANGASVKATYRVTVQIGGRTFTNKHTMTTFLTNP